MKLGTKIIGITLAAVGLSVVAGLVVQRNVIRNQGIAMIRDTMRAAVLEAETTRESISALNRQGAFDQKKLLEDFKKSGDLRSSALYQTVPVVAAWTAIQKVAEQEGYEFRVPKNQARNSKNVPTAEEQAILAKLEKGQVEEYFEVDRSNNLIVFAKPIKLTADCLVCHGDPKNSPTGDGKDLLGFPMENWKAGEVHGAFVLKSKLDRLDRVVSAGMLQTAAWVLPLSGAIAVAIFFFITRSIARPIQDCVGLTGQLAKGDFSQEVPERFRQRPDELGDLARAFHLMVGHTRNLLREVSGGVKTLAASATDLSTASGQTASSVKSMSERTSTVAAAAEEASANTTSVAASMEQAATNLASVATATEEMSATVGEIASNSEKARAISEQATAQAQTITTLMQQLGQAAQEIGKVTETITDISSQTNLLALNATIEAARAGAAGKGFAVVANEIKELARQTATATEDIKTKIAGVQASANGAITDIEKIAGVIRDVGAIVSSIAASIEEQAVVTKDVAGNIAQASAGVKDANERVAQTAAVSKSIAQDIAGISASLGDVRQGGEKVELSAGELSKLASQLQETVGQFKVDGAGAEAAAVASPRSAPAVKTRETKQGDKLIEWSDSLSVGQVTMDAHHQRLVSLINQLYTALKDGQGNAVTMGILKQVIAYTQYHFKAEEELMAKVNFSGLEAQKKVHGEFLRVVASARDRWEAGDETVPQELLSTLKGWLVQHITGMDKQYAPCFVRQAAGAKNAACPMRVGDSSGPGVCAKKKLARPSPEPSAL